VVAPPVFLVDALPDGGDFVLDGAEGHHAAVVRRLRPGETVHLSDGYGGLAECTVTAAGPGGLTLAVLARTVAEPPRPRFVLVQALAKGDRGELAVELATELGVDEVVPWQAARAVVQWRGERGEKALARWRAVVRAAAKQSRRPFVPAVSDLHTTREVCALIGRTTAEAGIAVALHAEASTALAAVPVPASGDVVLVVGPEGGLSEGELTAFRAAGAKVARLGPTILRTSTAGAAALAVLAVRAGRWS
jgi:16S rRNA (uracil1498-N3)-methyltransferase